MTKIKGIMKIEGKTSPQSSALYNYVLRHVNRRAL